MTTMFEVSSLMLLSWTSIFSFSSRFFIQLDLVRNILFLVGVFSLTLLFLSVNQINNSNGDAND